jgi:hypothetical protein
VLLEQLESPSKIVSPITDNDWLTLMEQILLEL